MLKLLFTAITLLAACNAHVTTPDEPSQDACKASSYEHLVGTNVAAFSHEAGENIRIIGPDTAVTMDYVPERLNVYFDADGIITAVRCG